MGTSLSRTATLLKPLPGSCRPQRRRSPTVFGGRGVAPASASVGLSSSWARRRGPGQREPCTPGAGAARRQTRHAPQVQNRCASLQSTTGRTTKASAPSAPSASTTTALSPSPHEGPQQRLRRPRVFVASAGLAPISPWASPNDARHVAPGLLPSCAAAAAMQVRRCVSRARGRGV